MKRFVFVAACLGTCTHAPSPIVATAAHADPGPARVCGRSAWSTYAHDAARTSASDGCIDRALPIAWVFAPESRTPSRDARVAHAIADGDSVYAQGTIGKSPALWRLDARTGAVLWVFDSRSDIARSSWPTIAPRTVVMVDDGVYLVDVDRGVNRGRELDAWGQSIAIGDRVLVSNTWQTDGYGPYLALLDSEARPLWKRDTTARERGWAPPDVGGIALDAGVVVHASNQYPRESYVSAFDARDGGGKWRVDSTTIESAPSVAGERMFAIEKWNGDKVDRVVTRSMGDGSVAWSREMPGSRGPSPVLVGTLVVVHSEAAVVAIDAASGEIAWTALLPRTAPAAQSATTLAAATGSGTLVVCSGARIHVLRLSDGSEVASIDPAPGASTPASSRAKTTRIDSPVIVGEALYVVAGGALVKTAE